ASGEDLLIVQFKMLDGSATIVAIGKIERGEDGTKIVNIDTASNTWDVALLDTFIQTYNAENHDTDFNAGIVARLEAILAKE
ncbi:MAG: hypothetical protein KDE24_36330, partial [Caldilinea sp.]|nr:hypothetical protein [Caldilinea sp.]